MGAKRHVRFVLLRFWHDAEAVPTDAQDCLNSWHGLKADGFETLTFHTLTFHDASAAAFIEDTLGPRNSQALARCRHPAMRSDYLLCFLAACDGFYVDNNPLVAPAGHPVLRRALERATAALLGGEGRGNLTVALAAHAYGVALAGRPRDFVLLRDWDQVIETRWELSYRADARNWRNVEWD